MFKVVQYCFVLCSVVCSLLFPTGIYPVPTGFLPVPTSDSPSGVLTKLFQILCKSTAILLYRCEENIKKLLNRFLPNSTIIKIPFPCTLYICSVLKTKDEPRTNLRMPNHKICVLLRLTSFFPLLYIASAHRPTSERRPRELRVNSPPTKSAICYDWLPKKVSSAPEKVVSLPKKVDSFPETVDLYSSPLHLTLYTLHQKNRTKMRFFLHIRKFCSTFAP